MGKTKNEVSVIKRVKLKLESVRTVKDGIATVVVEGNILQKYNRLDAAEKRAKKGKDALKPEIVELGLAQIFEANENTPGQPALTVKLQDEKNEVVRVEYTNSYGATDPQEVDALFAKLKDTDGKPVDVNLYVHETVVSTFDSKVFNDANGKFSEAKFKEYQKAIDEVALRLKDTSPLTSKKVTLPVEKFHELRWTAFPKASMQDRINEVLANTIKVVPVTVKAPVSTKKLAE